MTNEAKFVQVTVENMSADAASILYDEDVWIGVVRS